MQFNDKQNDEQRSNSYEQNGNHEHKNYNDEHKIWNNEQNKHINDNNNTTAAMTTRTECERGGDAHPVHCQKLLENVALFTRSSLDG